jgi:hypothetical protein
MTQVYNGLGFRRLNAFVLWRSGMKPGPAKGDLTPKYYLVKKAIIADPRIT